ncbi:hypothetical protein PENNAL_c0787G08625, partial [Penicillium nalgiovense]
AYIAGPSSIPTSSQLDVSYAENPFDPNLDPNLFNSQQTATSVVESDFIDLAVEHSSLQRIGPDRRKHFVLFDKMNDASKAKFIEWWRTTVRGSEPETQREPLVMCRSCGVSLPHPHSKQSGTNTMKRHLSTGKCQKASRNLATQQSIIQTMQHAAILESSRATNFSQDEWEREQIECITALNLPFRSLARKQLASLVRMAQRAPTEPTLLHPRTAQRRLKKIVYEEHHTILSTLPPNAKLSIALDCWTSPFQQAFMAITGYFIDQDWNYRELLLGFEPLNGPHSGVNLSEVLMEIFKKHDISDRILAITSDNASNNTTLVQSIQDSIDSLNLPSSPVVVRIPCLAHVIQLSLRELLGSVKADPQNDTTDTNFSNVEAQARSLHASESQ